MKNPSENNNSLRENISRNFKEYSMKTEMQVMILLLSLIAIGVIYNIVSGFTDKQHNFHICPLCEEPTNHVIYEQRNQRYTF